VFADADRQRQVVENGPVRFDDGCVEELENWVNEKFKVKSLKWDFAL